MRQALLKSLLLGSLLFVALSGNVQAEWAWLKHSAVAYFNEDDWGLLKKTATDLLNNGKDGDSDKWSNESSHNHGQITLLHSYKENNLHCRKLRFHNEAEAHGAVATVNFRFCQQADKSWKVSP